MCAHRLFDGPLVCDSSEPLPHTHRYHASDAPDRHTYTEPTEGVH